MVTEGTVYQDRISFSRMTGGWSGYFIEHSSETSAGNSGGPLIDENGWVIGINTGGAFGQKSGIRNTDE